MSRSVQLTACLSVAVLLLVSFAGPTVVTAVWRAFTGTTFNWDGYKVRVPSGWVFERYAPHTIFIFRIPPIIRLFGDNDRRISSMITIGDDSWRNAQISATELLELVPQPSRIVPMETGGARCAEGPIGMNRVYLISCVWPGGLTADYMGNERSLFLNFVRAVQLSAHH